MDNTNADAARVPAPHTLALFQFEAEVAISHRVMAIVDQQAAAIADWASRRGMP